MNNTVSKTGRAEVVPTNHTAKTRTEPAFGSLEAMSMWQDPATHEERTSEMDFCQHPNQDDFSEGDPEGLGYCRLM